MTWRSFVDFYLLREMGTEDTVMRNYVELREDKHHDNNVYCNSAIHLIGIDVDRGSRAWIVGVNAVMARLRDYGFTDVTFDKVRIRLNQWYVWHRIKIGSVQQWRVKTQLI